MQREKNRAFNSQTSSNPLYFPSFPISQHPSLLTFPIISKSPNQKSKMDSSHHHHLHRRLGYFSSLPPPPPPYPQIPYTLVKPKESHPKSNLNPSFMIIAIILVVVFFVSASIHLILRYLNRRCMSTPEDDDVASTEPVHVHRISSRRVVPEAHQSLIDSLPLFSFNTISGLKSSSADCAVCLSKFEMNDQLRLLPLCCHAFHSSCIDTWLGSNHTCPLCRSTVHVDGSEGYLKLFSSSSPSSSRSESFRVEIGNVSSRRIASDTGVTGISGIDRRRSYSIGSFEYLVEDETAEILVEPTHRRVASEIVTSTKKEENEATLALETNLNLNPNPPGAEIASEVSAGGRGWLKDYVDRLSVSSASISSRTLSFRLSGRFFTGSSRRSEAFTGSSRRSIENGGSWDLERNEYGEQIGNFLRWLSGV